MEIFKILEFVLYDHSSLPLVSENDEFISLRVEKDNALKLKHYHLKDDKFVEEFIDLTPKPTTIARLESFAKNSKKYVEYCCDGYIEEKGYSIVHKTYNSGKKYSNLFSLNMISYIIKDILPKKYFDKIFNENH